MFKPDSMLQTFIRYFGKLLVFLVVPGLHLFSKDKKIFGIVLAFIFLAALITPAFPEVEDAYLSYLIDVYPTLIGAMAWIVALVFILLDLTQIGKRPISASGYQAFAFMLGLSFFVPNPGRHLVLSNADHMCPAICFGDVVVTKPVQFGQVEDYKIKVGDIVIYRVGAAKRINRIIAGAHEIVCVVKPFQVTVRQAFGAECDGNYKVEKDFYFVSGDNPDPTKLGVFHHHKVIYQDDIAGIKPVVVANWSGWVNTLSYFIEE